MANRKDRVSTLLGWGIIIGFILPHSSPLLYMVNPLLCVLFWLLKGDKRIFRISALVIIPLLISLLTNLLQTASLKPILLCITIMMYTALFPFADREVSVKPVFFYVTLLIIMVSQIAYILDISFITNWLDTLYPIEGVREGMYSHMRRNITLENMINYRLGGLYRNPNDCARSITLLLASFLILFRDKKSVPFLALSFIAILLTGSRTGSVICAIIIVAYVFFCIHSSTVLRLGVIFAAVLVLLFLFLASNPIMRGLDISSGFNNSLNYKWDTFAYYIQNELSSVKLLFGHLDSDQFESGFGVMNKFDADYGYLVFNYGIIGFLGILIYSICLFTRMFKPGRVLFLVLLWMITSTVFSSFRCVFVYVLLLSLVFNQNKNGKRLKRL